MSADGRLEPARNRISTSALRLGAVHKRLCFVSATAGLNHSLPGLHQVMFAEGCGDENELSS